MTKEHLQIKEWRSEIILTDKIIHGTSKQKKYFFMANYNEFTFPLKQISSIRYAKERNISIKWLLLSIVLIIVGVKFISSFWFAPLLLWAFIVYSIITPTSLIRISTSGWDKLDYQVSQANIKNANQFIKEANELIASM